MRFNNICVTCIQSILGMETSSMLQDGSRNHRGYDLNVILPITRSINTETKIPRFRTVLRSMLSIFAQRSWFLFFRVLYLHLVEISITRHSTTLKTSCFPSNYVSSSGVTNSMVASTGSTVSFISVDRRG